MPTRKPRYAAPILAQYLADPRLKQAQQFAGAAPESGGVGAGLGSVLENVYGAYLGSQLDKDYSAQDQSYNKALADALARKDAGDEAGFNAALQADPYLAQTINESRFAEATKPREPFKPLVVDGAVLGPNYEVLYQSPEKKSEQPSAVKEYEYAKGQGYTGTFQQFKNDGARAGATSISINPGAPESGKVGSQLFPESTTGIKAPAGFGFNQNNELVALKGGDKDPNNIAAATEGERKDAFNYTRLLDAERILSNPDFKGFETPEIGASIVRATLGEGAGNVATSPKRQIYEGAIADAVDAALTLATGAAYTQEQLKAQRKAFVPQFGDDDKTIKEKALKRKALIDAAKARSGRAVGAVPDYLLNSGGTASGNRPPLDAFRR